MGFRSSFMTKPKALPQTQLIKNVKKRPFCNIAILRSQLIYNDLSGMHWIALTLAYKFFINFDGWELTVFM